VCDDSTEARSAHYFVKLEHDAERVVDVTGLGLGSDDREIVAYAEREDRLLVTYDDGFSRRQ
jgi:predicted nuclease of predicted toxin-antitoxin system